MGENCLDELRFDLQNEVQRHQQILKEHGDLRSAQLRHLPFWQRQEIDTPMQNPAGDDAPRRIDQAHDRITREGLARS
jgi:hypothetical protein